MGSVCPDITVSIAEWAEMSTRVGGIQRSILYCKPHGDGKCGEVGSRQWMR